MMSFAWLAVAMASPSNTRLINQLNQPPTGTTLGIAPDITATIRLLLSLGLVLVSIIWLLRLAQPWLRRFQAKPQGPYRIRLLTSQSLGGGRYLHVVSVVNQHWLIGSSPQAGIQLVSALPPATGIAENE